ncbi:DUF2157 domain-containing protein [Glycocaulis alkaliphilus]|nr:DUF2157 domain-containing protein [Glycocaulis alkaliphilus]GGB68376.1 hypothetical protein GCM10007417_05220 [Glycocaulis alkaliphilus]
MSKRRGLERNLDRWIAAGWVEPAHRDAILADHAQRPGHWSAAGAGLILGAVLLALAALSFVAANWAAMPQLARFALILAALWAALGGAGESFRRNNPALGHALALVGAFLFGAAIMLTAQTFNISAFRNTGILIWALGALAVAVAIPSRPVLALSALLAGSWMVLETVNPLTPRIVWLFVPLWLAVTGLAIRMESRLTANLLGAGLLAWLYTLVRWAGGGEGELSTPALFVSLALICAAGTLAFAVAEERGLAMSRIISRWLMTGAVISAFAAQFAIARASDGATTGLLLTGMVSIAAITMLALMRVRTGAMRPVTALTVPAIALAGLLLALIPWFAPGWVGALEVLAGIAVFALAAAMVAEGARAGRGFTGGLGLVLFIAQALHVYTALFGSLLDTALFFLVGGLLLIAMSVIAMRLQSRKHARTTEAQP